MKTFKNIVLTIKEIITWLTPLNFKQLIKNIKSIWSKFNV